MSFKVDLDENVWNAAPQVLPPEEAFVVIFVGVYPQVAILSDRFDGWAALYVHEKDCEYKRIAGKDEVIYWTRTPMDTVAYRQIQQTE